jgi:hypothetical protein
LNILFQANITYDEYLKSFYPYQDENVFTHNNWILSDEFVRLVQSNDFYRQHVRWNKQRFRPDDVTNEQFNTENAVETSQIQPLHLNNGENETPANNLQEMSQQQQQQQIIADNDIEEETASAYSVTASTKRKFNLNENSPERQTRTQPRRLKKN